MRVQVPAGSAEIVWAERLWGIWRASVFDQNPIRSAMISAYLQGAHDALRPEVVARLPNDLDDGEECDACGERAEDCECDAEEEEGR